MIVDSAKTPVGLAFLICFHILVCCMSLVETAYFQFYGYFSAGAFHIFYDPAGLRGRAVDCIEFPP